VGAGVQGKVPRLSVEQITTLFFLGGVSLGGMLSRFAVIFEQPVMSLEVVTPRIQVFSFMRVRGRPTTGPREMKGFTEIH